MKRDICHFVTKIMSVTCPSHFELVRNDRLKKCFFFKIEIILLDSIYYTRKDSHTRCVKGSEFDYFTAVSERVYCVAAEQ